MVRSKDITQKGSYVTTNTYALRAIREQSGFSQRELARIVGMDNSMLSLIESGSRQPSIDKAFAIAAVLRVDRRAIFFIHGLDDCTASKTGGK